MDNVLVLLNTTPAFREKLSSIFPDKNVIFNESTDLGGIDPGVFDKTKILIGNPSPRDIQRFPNLVWMQMQSNGPDKYLKILKDSDIVLSNSAGAYGGILSEHIIGFIFSLYKKLHLYRDGQREHVWKHRGEVKSVAGSVLLIVGLGDVGRTLARKMKALGCYVIGVRRVVRDKPDYVDEILLTEEMDKALPKADIVTLCMPETPATIGMFGDERFSEMKEGAIMINAGRGSAVVTDALCRAMEAGRLAGAALDVMDPEPLPPDHRLWNFENLVLTPHVVNSFTMRETYAEILDIILENAQRYASGKHLKNIIDFKSGYRKPPSADN